MTSLTTAFLKKLLDTAGPSGFEQAPGRVWREEVGKFADDVRVDVHGNSVASLNGKGKPRVMLTGHIDEIGIQITHVDEDVSFPNPSGDDLDKYVVYVGFDPDSAAAEKKKPPPPAPKKPKR